MTWTASSVLMGLNGSRLEHPEQGRTRGGRGGRQVSLPGSRKLELVEGGRQVGRSVGRFTRTGEPGNS